MENLYMKVNKVCINGGFRFDVEFKKNLPEREKALYDNYYEVESVICDVCNVQSRAILHSERTIDVKTELIDIRVDTTGLVEIVSGRGFDGQAPVKFLMFEDIKNISFKLKN